MNCKIIAINDFNRDAKRLAKKYASELEIEISESEIEQDITVILVAIYDKSEVENIDDAYLRSVIEDIEAELEDEN
jgi:hypothetical protein